MARPQCNTCPFLLISSSCLLKILEIKVLTLQVFWKAFRIKGLTPVYFNVFKGPVVYGRSFDSSFSFKNHGWIRTHVGGAIQKMVGYQQRGPRVGFSQLNYIGFEIGNNWIETPTVCHVFYGDSVILLWVGYCFGEIRILTHTFSCFIPKIS